MCCAASVCNGGAQRRLMGGLGWWVGRVTGRRRQRRRPRLGSRPRRWNVMCVSAPSFSWYSIVVVGTPPLANARDRHSASRPSLHLAQSAAAGPDRCRPRTRVGGVPCRARGNVVVVVVVARCRASGGRGARRRKPADRLDRIGSGRVGRLAVGGSLLLVFSSSFFLWVLEGRRGSVLQGAGAGRMWSCCPGVGGGVGGVGDGGGMGWSTRVRGRGGGCARSVRVVEAGLVQVGFGRWESGRGKVSMPEGCTVCEEFWSGGTHDQCLTAVTPWDEHIRVRTLDEKSLQANNCVQKKGACIFHLGQNLKDDRPINQHTTRKLDLDSAT